MERWFKILVLGLAAGLTIVPFIVGLALVVVAWLFGFDPDSELMEGLWIGPSIALAIGAFAYEEAKERLPCRAGAP
jgi:hypothetical protein